MFRGSVEACSPMSVDSDQSREESMNVSDCYSPQAMAVLSPVPSRNPQGTSLFSPIEKTLDLFDDLNLGPTGHSPCTMTPNRPSAVANGDARGSRRKKQENPLGYLALDDYASRNKFLRKRHTIACFSQPALDNNDNSFKYENSFNDNRQDIAAEKNSSPPKMPTLRQRRKKNCCTFKGGLMFFVLFFALLILCYIAMLPHMCQYTLNLDMPKLNQSLHSKVFGQPIAVDLVSRSVNEYLHGKHNKPALVMSLHGWTGVGKNHITNIIASHIRSKSVRRFIIPLHYPHRNKEVEYSDLVVTDTVQSLRSCAINLIVFDEIDKAGPVLVEGISHAIEAMIKALREDMKLIILLLSNTGGRDINTHVYEKIMAGGNRKGVHSKDLVEILLNADKYSESWHYKFHQGNLIDHFVPLLPLGENEVRKCIIKDMEVKGLKVTEVRVGKVNENIQYFPADMPLFSVTGCRAVAAKVDQVIL